MRYNRLRDIGLTDDQIKKNLLFATDKVGDTMKVSLDPKPGQGLVRRAPPDLSVIARSRAEVGKGSGADYLYTYLRTFYRDDTKADRLEQPRLPRRRACRTRCGSCRASGARSFVEVKDPHDPSEDGAPLRRLRAGHARHARRARSTTRRSATWSPTCSGWASRRRNSACASASACCIFLGLLIVITWRLNAAYWKDVS